MTRDQGEDREGALAETGRGGESGPRCVPLGALSRQMVRVLLMSGTSSFCRRWAERSKTPEHHVSTAVSSLWPPGAGDPEGCRPPAAGIEAVPGPELAALSPELFFLRRSLKALLIAQSELPQPTVSSTPRAACISSDVASVLSPPPLGTVLVVFHLNNSLSQSIWHQGASASYFFQQMSFSSFFFSSCQLRKG